MIISSLLSRTPFLSKWPQKRYMVKIGNFKPQVKQKLNVPPIPRSKLDYNFTASSGPGGQNVNHVNTKVEIRFKPEKADWIPEALLERFMTVHSHKLNKEGDLIITSQKFRKQNQNLEDCIQKLKDMLEESSWLPKERQETAPPAYAKENRMKAKKIRSEIKRFRSKADW